MSTVTETDLSALLHRDGLVLLDTVGEDIHHLDLVSHCDKDVETTWVEGHSQGGLTRLSQLAQFQLLLMVVPDVDGAFRAGNDQLLPEADIHSCDLSHMEG